MSSSYATAKLEAERKERLKRDLADSIQKLKVQLQKKHENRVQAVYGRNIKLSVFAEDGISGGYDKNAVITGSMLQIGERPEKSEHKELDFSELLYADHKKPGRLEKELDSWIRKIDERPIITEKDEEAQIRLWNALTPVIKNETMDIEERLEFVKMRVSTYLKGKVNVTPEDAERMESAYFEYCALCELLEEEPTVRVPERIEKEVKRMTIVLEKRKQEQYIMGVIESAMRQLGCPVRNDADVILDGIPGQMYSMDGHSLCDVFIGRDASGGILFEPVGSSRDGSLNQKRKIKYSADSFCSRYSQLEEYAAKEGVILKICGSSVNVDNMYDQSDVRRTSTDETSIIKKQKKAAALKQRALDTEG